MAVIMPSLMAMSPDMSDAPPNGDAVISPVISKAVMLMPAPSRM